MPSFGSAPNPGTQLQGDIKALAPLATQWHGAQTGVSIAQYTPTPSTSSQSGLSKFAHFIGGAAGEVGHITASVGKWIGEQGKQMVMAPIDYGSNLAHGWLDKSEMSQIAAQSQQDTDKLATITKEYKAGRISATQYKISLNSINQDLMFTQKQGQGMANRLKADQNQSVRATINTATDLVTILTAGFGKATGLATDGDITMTGIRPYAAVGAKSAADYLTSVNANAFLSDVETGLTRLATDPEAFAKLSPMAQKAIQGATAEVLSQAGERMTAAQIARASAVNLALKYPIYFNWMSSTGKQLYTELDQKKYGAAVRTLAFNAALVLSGGPIGRAVDVIGKGFSGAVSGVFGRTSFLDELSKGIGNGVASGLFDAINKLPEAERADAIKQMSAVEATNMRAAGNDAVAAAWRVLDGMSSYEGASMSTFSHDEALANMMNFAKAQRLASETASDLGLGPVTVGRVDARSLTKISAALNSVDAVDRPSVWENLKSMNPNQAWANNVNLDKQIKTLISEHQDAITLDGAIRNIKAGFFVKGFDKGVAKTLSKMGYIPIQPSTIEAPFQEGIGKLSSRFAENSDFFTHTVQPLPVLSHIGAMLTAGGLSPTESSQRVYELFNQNVVEALAKTDVFGAKRMIGENDAQTADYLIKKLSDYSHDLSGRKLPIKAPITDLRQLTTSDVMHALDVNASDARSVKYALRDAMLKVPLSVRGMGDRIMDINYKWNPASKAYARLQGALRFAWNPFFQVKLATKTEFLAQMQAGGKLPPISGIASVFSKEYGDLDNIRSILRSSGIFEESSTRYGALGGSEAVQEGSAVGANLTHHMLPIQEKSIAGLVATQAEKANMDVQSFVDAFPNEVRDTVQTIVGYDRRSQLLNSPLMRTLNFAFFPARFETKVAMITAKALAQTSTMTQIAVIKGFYNGSNWLRSNEGQAWYSQNANVIGMFQYFSPSSTLSSISQALTGLSQHSLSETVGAFELGGLPFGWIPQLLDAEGLTHFGQSYVNPTTGAVALDYVPVTARGQLQTAISDMLGGLFTYPGSTVGLPSKGTVTRYAATAITGGKSTADFQTSTPPISQQQQNFQQVIQGLAGNRANSPAPLATPQTTSVIHVPAEPSTNLAPKLKAGTTASGAKAKKLKKAQFTPYLLPGQTKLGQL